MPLYDWVCAHGHEFEAVVAIADRETPIPCQGKVNQLCDKTDEGAQATPLPLCEVGEASMVYTREVPCALKAKRVEIAHSHPAALLDYGLGANRDAAREGRYNPDRPSTRGVRKSQI